MQILFNFLIFLNFWIVLFVFLANFILTIFLKKQIGIFFLIQFCKRLIFDANFLIVLLLVSCSTEVANRLYRIRWRLIFIFFYNYIIALFVEIDWSFWNFNFLITFFKHIIVMWFFVPYAIYCLNYLERCI